jgi:hypothetical protein
MIQQVSFSVFQQSKHVAPTFSADGDTVTVSGLNISNRFPYGDWHSCWKNSVCLFLGVSFTIFFDIVHIPYQAFDQLHQGLMHANGQDQ